MKKKKPGTSTVRRRRAPPAASGKEIAARGEPEPQKGSSLGDLFAETNSNRTRMGRPGKEPVPGKKMSLGLKVIAELKYKLDDAARANGRTQSQEAEARIERSFDREGLLGEVLSLAYGREIAGFVMMLGRVMKETAELVRARVDGPWFADERAYLEVERAVMSLLSAGRPKGGTSQQGQSSEQWGGVGLVMTNQMLRTLRGDWNIMDESFNPCCDHIDTIRSLMGPIRERMIQWLETDCEVELRRRLRTDERRARQNQIDLGQGGRSAPGVHRAKGEPTA